MSLRPLAERVPTLERRAELAERRAERAEGDFATVQRQVGDRPMPALPHPVISVANSSVTTEPANRKTTVVLNFQNTTDFEVLARLSLFVFLDDVRIAGGNTDQGMVR